MIIFCEIEKDIFRPPRDELFVLKQETMPKKSQIDCLLPFFNNAPQFTLYFPRVGRISPRSLPANSNYNSKNSIARNTFETTRAKTYMLFSGIVYTKKNNFISLSLMF